jgi:fructokinase
MRIGIDLGGTKIEAIALADSGAIVNRERVSTPRSYTQSVSTIVSLVRQIEATVGAHPSVGIGIPGVPNPDTGLIKNANSVWLNGQPLGKDLEARLGRPVRLANDANCFALSEASDGAGAGASVVFGVILGTGVGGGVVVDGRPLVGPNLIAGEWGHNALPWATDAERPGPQCYCGKRGCIESFLSGPGFEHDFAVNSGRRQSSREIVAAAGQRDADAQAALDRYYSRLGRALASVINLLDPDVIVLGGGLSNIDSLYRELPPLVERYAFTLGGAPRVVKNRHGDSSGVRGAAWLWPDV